jgi:uncharacterized protein Veg
MKCLLLGYLGANNMGCGSRLLTVAEDIRQTVGEKVKLTAAVLKKNTVRRYIKSDETKKC